MCPDPYYGVNTTNNFICVQYCPSNEYKYVDGDLRMCLTSCPNGTFTDNLTMSCVETCPDYYYGNTDNN